MSPSISRRLPVLFLGPVAPRCSLDVLKRRAVPKTFLKRGKVSIGCWQGEPPRGTNPGSNAYASKNLLHQEVRNATRPARNNAR